MKFILFKFFPIINDFFLFEVGKNVSIFFEALVSLKVVSRLIIFVHASYGFYRWSKRLDSHGLKCEVALFPENSYYRRVVVSDIHKSVKTC